MEDLEQAIQGVLNDPQMMQKIMGMAQAFGGAQSEDPSPEKNTSAAGPDLSQMAQLGGLLKGADIDSDQQNLLKALSPYMSSPHIERLRRAMQAARLAELANSMMGSSPGRAGDGSV